jgi:hypothetical protein
MSQLPPKPQHSIAGALALLVLGLLILVPSGLCTGIMGGGAILTMVTYPKNASGSVGLLSMALIIGGPFVIGGAAMVWNAVKWLRDR